MKKLIPGVFAWAVIAVVSCNSNPSLTEEHANMNHTDSMPMAPAAVNQEIETVSVSFPRVDEGVSAYMKEMVQYYLAVKNALTNDNESAAAAASDKMVAAMKGFDKSLLTADQKKVYDNVEDDLKEQAAQIAKNKLDRQRDHFSKMSEDIYSLVKAYGAGMTLYHDHCPMAKENNGAMWLSETKDIRNPYFGDKMMTCGSVEEMFK